MRMILEEHFLLYGILATGLIGLISRLILVFSCRKLLKEAENMGNSSHETLVLMKNKYENCIRVNRGIRNTEVFVEKYLHKYQAGGTSLRRMGNITYEMILCAIILGCVGGVGAFFESMEIFYIVLYPASAVLMAMLLLFFEAFLETDGKLEQIKITIVDYLENTMTPRLQLQTAGFQNYRAAEAAYAPLAGDEAREVSVALQWDSAEEEALVKEVLEDFLP